MLRLFCYTCIVETIIYLHQQRFYEYRVFHPPFLVDERGFHENCTNHRVNLQPSSRSKQKKNQLIIQRNELFVGLLTLELCNRARSSPLLANKSSL